MRRVNSLFQLAFLLGATAVVGVLAAAPGVVVTKDGREIAGNISEGAGDVRVEGATGVTVIRRDEIREIRRPQSVDVLYQEKAAQLGDRDAEGHYILAEWCRQQERYDLVLQEARKVLSIDPKHENASLLRKLAERKLRETREIATKPTLRSTAALLSDADIQQLRWWELAGPGRQELDEVRVEFAKGFLDQFMRDMKDKFLRREDRERFLRARSTEQFRVLVDMCGSVDGSAEVGKPVDAARRLYADRIRIVDDPFVFREFKRVVLPAVTKGCGTADCHGGATTRGFRLLSDRLQPTRSLYTNFFILDAATDKSGKYHVIDRDRPPESLLLHYGLPVEMARYTHPALPVPIKPLFRGPDDRAWHEIRIWTALLRIPHPDYGVQLEGAATKRPAERAPAGGGK